MTDTPAPTTEQVPPTPTQPDATPPSIAPSLGPDRCVADGCKRPQDPGTDLCAAHAAMANATLDSVPPYEPPAIAKTTDTRDYLAEPAEPFPVASTHDAYTYQVGGSHYRKLKIQPMKYSIVNNLGAAEHTVIKYVTRWKDVAGLKDLRKARHALDILIQEAEQSGLYE